VWKARARIAVTGVKTPEGMASASMMAQITHRSAGSERVFIFIITSGRSGVKLALPQIARYEGRNTIVQLLCLWRSDVIVPCYSRKARS
jgi:hypothetical protein